MSRVGRWLAGVGRGRGMMALVVGVLGAGWASPVRAVDLSLRIPEADSWVLGDVIPLHWRFVNRAAQPLGFLWEGCCRLNGRLEVRAADGSLPMLPQGQALAHMFARADRLEPGTPKEYETRVADWVALPGTGTFELRGAYRGVLPSQSPQVPRGLALWREAAESPPVRLSILSVADYLSQAEERSRRRGVRLHLEGPGRVPPAGAAEYRLTMENLADRPQSVPWPEDVAVWWVDRTGRRSAPSLVLNGAVETWVVPAGGRAERRFSVASERLEGEAFGDYRLFVEWVSREPGTPRVPSNPLPVAWQWTDAEVSDLVTAAARGAGTGARNAPLKLLRVHLAEAGPALERVARLGGDGAAPLLARRLAVAARLQPWRSGPGPVELEVAVAGEGDGFSWGESVQSRAQALGLAGVESGLRSILEVRRHLGWEVTVRLVPDPAVRLAEVAAAVSRLQPLAGELSGPVWAGMAVGAGATNVPPARVVFVEPGGAAGGARIRVTASGVEGGSAPVPATGAQAAGPVEVESEGGMSWGAWMAAVRPLAVPGREVRLRLAAGGTGGR